MKKGIILSLLISIAISAASYNSAKAQGRLTQTVKGVTFNMVQVEAGTFQMGADRDKDDFRNPVHTVTISQNYYIAETEVTNALWMAVMGKAPNKFVQVGDNYPADYISWKDAQKFIAKLNKLTGKTFRLPTEAEWEYAARGGKLSKGYKYSGGNDVNDVAWNHDNTADRNGIRTTNKVATRTPNELGIFDMSGNVAEWCQDWYEYYSNLKSATDPMGGDNGPGRVVRGGSWQNGNELLQVESRYMYAPNTRTYGLGFRLAL